MCPEQRDLKMVELLKGSVNEQVEKEDRPSTNRGRYGILDKVSSSHVAQAGSCSRR
jgi:hypothetical protein